MKRRFDSAVYVSDWNAETYRFDDRVLHRDACIQETSSGARYPGKSYMLKIPSIDRETGTEIDVDGDRSYERFELHSAQIDLFSADTITITGYIEEREDKGRGEYPTGNFRLAQWEQIPYKWIREREKAEREEAKKAVKLTDREREIVVAIAKHTAKRKEAAAKQAGYTSTWVEFIDTDEVEVEGVTIRWEEIPPMFSHKLGEILMYHDHGDTKWVQGYTDPKTKVRIPGGKKNVKSVTLCSVGEAMAKKLLKEEVVG